MSVDVDRRRTTSLAHLLGGLVVLLVAAADPGGWYPFATAKWVALTVLVPSAGAVAVWQRRRPSFGRWWTAGWAVLLVALALAALFGRDPWYAWSGTPERHLGVVTWVLLAACGWLAAGLDRHERRVLARWVVTAALWCGGYAILELIGAAPIDVGGPAGRLGGPFGSAAYLGAAACLLIPLVVGVAADREQPLAWRVAGGAAGWACWAALVGSGTRAAWVGIAAAGLSALAVSSGLDGLLDGWRPRGGRQRRAIVGAAICVIAATAVIAPRFDDLLDRPAALSSRLDEWALAGRVLAAHPLLGTGPEGYRTALADGVTAEYERRFGRDVLPDRAHQNVLDVALAGGPIAAAAYVLLVTGTIATSIRRRRAGTDPPPLAVIAAAAGYAVQGLFLFPLAELDPVWWMVLGMLAAKPSRDGYVAPNAAGTRRALAAVLGVVLGLVGGAALVIGVVSLAADRAAAQLDVAGARRAVELRPDVVRYRLLLAATETSSGTLDATTRAVRAADRAVDLSPHDPIAQRAAAQARLDLARITGAPADLDDARAAWRRLVDADPLCRACQYGLGEAAALDGDADAARAAWLAAAALSTPCDASATRALARLDAVAAP